MRQLNAIFALLLLISLSFALFTDRFAVQVLDEKGRPIEGAEVTVSYQYRSKSLDNITRVTDRYGMANVTLQNVEYNERLVDYNFRVDASYGDDKNAQEASGKYVVGKHANTLTLTLRVYTVVIGAFDQNGKPLIALAKAYNFQKLTDSSGRAVFQVPLGATTIGVTYGGITKEESVSVDADVARDFEITLYRLRARVVDENGNPLEGAVVRVGSQANVTGAGGYAELGNIESAKVSIEAEYRGVRKIKDASLGAEGEQRVVFDGSAPVIRDVNVTDVNGTGVVRIFAEDQGQYASGLGIGSKIYVKYVVEGRAPAQANMYPSGKNRYQAEIPPQKAGTTVRYTIYVRDVDGNENSVSGEYEVVGAGAQADGGAVSPPQQAGGGGGLFGIDWPIIIGAGAVLLVLAGAYAYFKFKEEQ